MKMTINESKRLLRNHLDGVTNYCERELTDKAIQVAIETMRKYQKIEQIVGNYGFDTSWLCLKKIREVLEDGRN